MLRITFVAFAPLTVNFSQVYSIAYCLHSSRSIEALSLSLCPYLLYPLTHSRVNERMNVSHIESFVLILTYSLARDNSTANRSQRRRTLLSPSISFHFEPILSTGSRAGLTTFCQG